MEVANIFITEDGMYQAYIIGGLERSGFVISSYDLKDLTTQLRAHLVNRKSEHLEAAKTENPPILSADEDSNIIRLKTLKEKI